MNKLTNVIIICDFGFTKGGSEKVAIESAIGLANRGINVTYFCASGPIDERLHNDRINVICLNQKAIVENDNKFLGMMQGIWNITAKSELEKVLDKHSNDNTIVHLHLWQKALSGSIISPILKKKFKVIFTMHHYFIACPNGGFFNYKENKICDYKAMGAKCIKTNCDSRNYLYKIWRCARLYVEQNISSSLKGITNYIYISELGKNALQPYLSKESKYYYIENPIDIKKLPLEDIKKNEYYVYIGRLSREKGVSMLAETAKRMKLNIIFVGEGECRDEILSIYPDAKITGWVDKETVDSYMKNARALIFPSLWYEGMPLSVLECQSRGIPVITTDTCAAIEVIEDDINGYLFKSSDIEGLERKIIKSQNDDILERLSIESYNKFWSNDYSLDAHLNKLIEVYNEIL